MRKLLCCALCSIMALSFVGCGRQKTNKPDSKDITTIKVINFNGGIGEEWLYKAKGRFEALKAEESYEEGKKGVYVAVDGATNLNVDAMNTSAYNIFFDENTSSIYGLAQKGYLSNIDDIVKETMEDGHSIEDRIYEEQRASCKGGDNNYYALPHYEWYPGITYDKDLFDSNKLYIAKEDCKNVRNHKTVAFVQKLEDKSCGKDGVYGTEDDGLPTTIKELVALCSLMNSLDIEPITISGGNKRYSDYLLFSLWASLSGKEAASAMYTFDGEVEVVTGFSGEALLPGMGVDYIKKPITEKVKVTEATGWQAHETAAKYYTQAFFEILYKEKWFSNDAWEGTLSHTDAQYNYILGSRLSGKDKGILIEGSYWYNESVDAGNFSAFNEYFPGENRNIKFMPLPCSLDTPIKEGQGQKALLMDEGHSFAFINKNTERNAGVLKACKDFLKFLYTDEEIVSFTTTTGSFKALNYDLSEEDINNVDNEYQKDILKLRKNGEVIYGSALNKTFKAGGFKVSINSSLYNPRIDGVVYDNYMNAMLESDCNSQILFKATSLKDSWNKYYKGE